MMKDNLLLTLIGLLSLVLSQFLITKFQLADLYITLYWLGLGLFCTFTLVRSRRVIIKSILLKGVQVLNFTLGGFAFLTSSLIGLSYII